MTQRDFYLDLYAKGVGGPDTHVADPPTFAHFLLQKASEFDSAIVRGAQGLRHLWQVNPNVPSGSPLAIPDPESPTTFRGALETPAFQSYLPSAVTRQLPETIARPLVENLTSPLGIAGGASAPARAVGSVALGLLAEEAARRANAPPAVQTIAGLGGGIVGGAPEIIPSAGRLTLRGAQAAGRAGATLAEEAGRANVGNVLLPPAPPRVVRPLIYENLHPIERQLYGIQSKGRLTLDEVSGARDYLYGPADPITGHRPGGLVSSEDTNYLQNFEERYRGTHQLAVRRREIARVLAKYVEPETPMAAGPIAQAGFGGELGPAQIARGNAERAGRMVQAPLSEIAATEASRIAEARAPFQPPPSAPPVPPSIPPAGPVPVAGGTTPPPPPTTPAAVSSLPPKPPPAAPKPSGIDPDPFRLGNITPGLDPWDTLLNRVKQQFQDVTGARGSLLVRKDPNVNPAFDERARIIRAGASHAVNVEAAVQTAIRDAKFTFDKEGRIPTLANADFPQGPTLADLAAKLPNFTLTNEQSAAMQSIKDNLAPFKAALDKTGVEYGQRPDIVPGGFYFPRVSDLPPEQLAQVRVRGVRGGRGGFEKTATQPTQAAGIEAGIGYLPPADAARLHINEVARRVADAQTANYLKPLGVSAQTPPRGMSSIALSPLQGTAFPNAMADAANKVLAEEGRLSGKGSGAANVANAVNDLMQATSTTLDNSAAGIQGLVGLGADPGAFGRALTINVRAWRDPEVLSRYIASNDPQALQRGTLTASQKASLGLHLSGSNPAELTVRGRIGQLPGISAANRAFTALGDSLRLSWSDDILYEELQRGRTMQEIISSGDAERVMRIANRMTGTADVGFMQQFLPRPLLFASRFLQARIETVGQGVMGLRSLSLTDIPLYPAKYDVTVGFKVPIDQRIARQSLLRLIGGAALLTVAANEVQGRDTDFRPIVNGRFNGNFMRLRLGNRDFSLLGTWDSLFRAGVTIGTGHPLEAARSLSSPLVSLAWDIGSGTNAIGKSITTWPQRALRVGQAVAPLGLAQAPQAVQEAIQGAQQGSNTVAAGGAVGAAAELTGFKSAPLSFTDIANDISQRNYGAPFADLEPYQRKEVQKSAEAKMPQQLRGDPRSRYFARVKELDAIRLKEEAALVAKYRRDGNKLAFTNGYFDAQTRMQAAKDEAAHTLGITFDDQGDIRSSDPNARALAEYYALFDRTREQAGTWDSALFERLLAEQDRKWTHEQGQYILRNINLAEHAPGVIQLLPSATRQRIAKSEQARAAYGRRRAA